MALRQNAGILDYSRTSMSSLSGSAAGILGLTGLYGFAFYFITAFILSVSYHNHLIISLSVIKTECFNFKIFTSPDPFLFWKRNHARIQKVLSEGVQI